MKLFNFKNTNYSFGVGEAYITAYTPIIMERYFSHSYIELRFSNWFTYMGICAMIMHTI